MNTYAYSLATYAYSLATHAYTTHAYAWVQTERVLRQFWPTMNQNSS